MRKANTALTIFGLFTILLIITFIDAKLGLKTATPALESKRQLIAELGLTDLALFTEARYTRHLSQADLHTAFQDHPMAIEHFPSGSLISPPPHLSR
ncbi:MAG: hypothetical protein DSZ28_04480 [Thiothrix sp.]|nr:MAG: hypothetical protein DSZ28_04480 [Thiothrix sp.]